MNEKSNRSERLKAAFGAKEVTIEECMEQERMERKEAYEFFKSLEQSGLGRVVLGRGSNQTRLVWADRGGVTRGSDETTARSGFRVQQSYTVPLNADGDKALFTLPVDLSKDEAERLCGFIRSLAFE